jgi:ABC-type dipeptide/oligopeptide/nickel transport system permease subunit
MASRKASMSFALQRFRGFWKQFSKSKLGIIGVAILLFFVIVAVFAPVIAQYDPIRPMAEVGQYPAYGPGIGRKIAQPLCYPAWYKYLPWITQGQLEVTEEFYNLVIAVPELHRIEQIFGRKGEVNATDNVIILTRRVSNLTEIVATFPNGTSSVIPKTDFVEPVSDPRTVQISNFYPNGTNFKVRYDTGASITENMLVVQDAVFSSDTSVLEWQASSDPDARMTYNSTGGTSADGCVEFAYVPTGSPQATVQLNMSRPFVYSYWEPPRQVFGHFSYKLEGADGMTMTVLIRRADEPKLYVLETYEFANSSTWNHMYYDSYSPEVRHNVGTERPLDLIFAYPENYTFAIQVTLKNPTSGAKLYMDNVHVVLYGNSFGLLGTDNGVNAYPLDIFSTLVHGTRISLAVGVFSALFSTLIGLFLGLVSGYLGGIADEGIMRFADLLLVLPTLPLFIVLIIALRSIGTYVSVTNIIVILTLFGWMGFARSVRSMVISLRERAFVEAAKASGAGTMHIINRHILPNVFALVYITLATAVPGAIITEASLSWLGLGDPLTASWGKILYDFQTAGIALTKGLAEYWFWVFPACIAIALLATAFILIGYALDEILNPRLRERR